jgi:hypothetical protein
LSEGARKLLQAAIENEVAVYLQSQSGRRSESGERSVVRNGNLPERDLVTGVGPVKIRQPRVWEASKAALLDVPSWRTFDAQVYAAILGKAKTRGVKIWNAAYMQKPQYREDLPTKHERYLALLQYMIQDGVTQKLKAACSYRPRRFRRSLFRPI